MKDYLDYMDPYSGFYCEQGKYLIIADFDPKTGERIEQNLKSAFQEIMVNEFGGKEKGNKRAIKKRIMERLKEWRLNHTKSTFCPRLYDLGIGADAGTTRVMYVPMIREYVICPSSSFVITDSQDFEPMDFCPFCGARLPERLDEKLKEILRQEYGLESWKDYKKAPKEFHTDKWWKKRGL